MPRPRKAAAQNRFERKFGSSPPEPFERAYVYRYRLHRWDEKKGWVLMGRYQRLDYKTIDKSAEALGGELQLVDLKGEAVAEWADGKRMPEPSGFLKARPA